MPRVPTRPWPLALVVGLASEALFAFRVAVPHTLVFDEVHYVTAARTLLTLQTAANKEHPLLGKALVALGMALFGDGPVGWRVMSTLAATGVVTGMFAILWLLYRRPRTALVGSGIAALNFTVFVQARIAMLDGFMACFVVLALAAMVWAMRGTGAQVWRRWTLGAVLLGLAAGTKWTAIPYGAFAAIGFAAARHRAPWRWPGLGVARAWAILGGAGLLAYLVTFAPAFFYAREPLTLATLLPLQRDMFALQTQVLPAHIYQSPWYSWPLEWRPIWYLYEPVDGALRGILLLGNPAVMAGGLVAVAACLWAWARGGERRAGAGLDGVVADVGADPQVAGVLLLLLPVEHLAGARDRRRLRSLAGAAALLGRGVSGAGGGAVHPLLSGPRRDGAAGPAGVPEMDVGEELDLRVCPLVRVRCRHRPDQYRPQTKRDDRA